MSAAQVKSQPEEGDCYQSVSAARVKSQPEEERVVVKVCRLCPLKTSLLEQVCQCQNQSQNSVSNPIQYHLKVEVKKMKSEINSVNQSIRTLQLWIAPPEEMNQR